METICEKYSDVKSVIIAVKQLSEDLGYRRKGKTKLSDAYYLDYGIYEVDWDFFLEEYERRFNLTLEGLIYEDYFPEQNPLYEILKLPLRIIMKIFSLFSMRMKRIYINIFGIKCKRLEVGDLVLSVLNKRFASRPDYKLILTS
ncbi:hypothetical protein HZQ75_16835 [Elizabethkingia anophelis]|uniref:Uncharacterized protein n=1 Tax=Elizabethkingia anophelis R26 TaxID=1246994 RepID=A0ABN5BSZ3_9FLAO|nr:DUF1493 family protein [Elizabethkingia anophelis]ATC36111.1 hypothetical protein BAZ09_007720 [Elizabethkingia anophelis R26]ATC39788.1 hypothetical protein EAAG1_007935 [Elizabethkingia anophelis Ag1]ATC43467.1 hypothetical protein CMV41_07935 [Elizabethkingia anophelis]ATC47143.1 hypothetical protein CMV40_07935 [Elizabethkingia anophelis]ELR80705.1 hypothetical protein D505_03042 [Elizabethkingia anophelis R26]